MKNCKDYTDCVFIKPLNPIMMQLMVTRLIESIVPKPEKIKE